MAINRREFLILGAGFGFTTFGFSPSAQAENGSSLAEFSTLIAQAPPIVPVFGRHSGFMVQSDYGDFSNNFEVVFPSRVSGLAQVYRDNAQSQFPWFGPLPPEYAFTCSPQGQTSKNLHGSFFGSGDASDVGLIQSNFKDFGSKNGHLELIVRHGDRLALYWRASNVPLLWTGPLYIPSSEPHRGNPAMVQSTFGTLGNFEVVVPHGQSGLIHYVRFNDNPDVPWSGANRFAEELGQVDAVALLQSDYLDAGETDGHLEVIARSGTKLFSLWRSSQPPYKWTLLPQSITDGLAVPLAVTGVPGFIQTSDRDFHLVVPLQNGGMAHLRRQNNLDASWVLESQFGGSFGAVSAVSLLQNKSSTTGLDLLARVAKPESRFEHFYASTEDLTWNPGSHFEEQPKTNMATEGEWQVPYSLEFGTVGVHAALLHTGNVLFLGYEDIVENENSTVSILNPTTGKQVNVLPNPQRNKFCCGHAFLSDGRLVLASGNVGETSAKSLHTFTPNGDSGTWTDFGAMSGGIRWYPTCTTLPDGRVLILAGTAQVFTTIHQTTCSQDFASPGVPRQVNKSYEIFDGATKAPSIPVPELFDDCEESLGLYGLYPFVYVLPDGRLLIHGNTRTYFLDINTNTVDLLPARTQLKTSRTYPSEGSTVLLPLRPEENYQAKVMILGGGVACSFVPSQNPNCGQGQPIDPISGNPVQTNCQGDFRDDWPSTDQCEILNISALDQGWKVVAAMNHPRVLPDAVLLPDGTVFVCGGSSTGTADAARMPVMQAELYNPSTNQWKKLASMHVPRLYHAAAILLPSGEVMTSGTDKFYNVPPFDHAENRVEVFKPPYLFKGPRPKIVSVTNQVGYGEIFSVFTSDTAAFDYACFIAPGAATHSLNMQQRWVGLKTVNSTLDDELLLEAPPNSNIAPPGYYMLFLMSKNGVPSEAKFIKLNL
ncbi:galactose oxidase-like domain-containing protein [Egbenema bharatensis]|uniref:galactose oxidase-like domain-containing protein n=1 Tax=Egbenema bharatensis TaxID=3463334 RepID=UPI003A87C89A